ncbi:hypothetical protein SEA_JUSTBECAUSE_227 [Streptomyces phage JustBecause]|nr:hypothetical protein SEA_JUSTBECAUSE_227 [Streptomyces phage JustBecause]
MTKFRPPSWAEPEPGEDTIEIEYTDGSTTKELHLPPAWRIRCSSFRRLRQAVASALSSCLPTKK